MITIGPWQLDTFILIYNLSKDAFTPPLSSDGHLKAIVEYIMTDVEDDIVTIISQTVYDTHTTDTSLAIKLKRCLALCTLQTLNLEHGMTLPAGAIRVSESISDFAHISTSYPDLTDQALLKKPRKAIISAVLSDVTDTTIPLVSSPVHGDVALYGDMDDITNYVNKHAY